MNIDCDKSETLKTKQSEHHFKSSETLALDTSQNVGGFENSTFKIGSCTNPIELEDDILPVKNSLDNNSEQINSGEFRRTMLLDVCKSSKMSETIKTTVDLNSTLELGSFESPINPNETVLPLKINDNSLNMINLPSNIELTPDILSGEFTFNNSKVTSLGTIENPIYIGESTSINENNGANSATKIRDFNLSSDLTSNLLCLPKKN